ncbi:hypothetical protein [Bacillus sonorensis]|uniref:hypothetical protein n=1 Tax=Bacillus sonorensis TaxID=119858 RepID=UPI0022827E23|nr:hypothetical protein [Bacillus sonorensis]MCY8034293.1 hypothetical protein [Bacillus sonorensis]MCY8565348.1 hypothetical protein [Bacillus sonorensis]
MIEQKRLIWSPNWIYPFESSWSILQKIMSSNFLSPNDLLATLGREEIKKLKNPSIAGRSKRDLISLRFFSNEAFLQLLGQDVKTIYVENCSRILLPLSKNPLDLDQLSNYFYDQLTFCPKCIHQGFHSIFHQLRIFDKCHYHGRELLNKCPNCNKDIEYYLSKDAEAFSCYCGYNFLKYMKQKYNILRWNLTDPIYKIRNSTIQNWLKVNRRDFDIFISHFAKNPFTPKKNLILTVESILYINNLQIQSKPKNNTAFEILHAPKELYNDLFNHLIQRKPYSTKEINDKKAMRRQDFNRVFKEIGYSEIYFESILIYKSIHRYLRKTFLKKHKKIKSKNFFENVLQEKNPPPIIRAYGLWRFFSEQLYIRNVNTLGFDKIKRGEFSYFNHIYSWRMDFLYVYSFFLFSQTSITYSNLKQLKSILHKMNCHFLLQLFNFCLKNCKTNEEGEFTLADTIAKKKNELFENLAAEKPQYTIIIEHKNSSIVYYKSDNLKKEIKKNLIKLYYFEISVRKSNDRIMLL